VKWQKENLKGKERKMFEFEQSFTKKKFEFKISANVHDTPSNLTASHSLCYDFKSSLVGFDAQQYPEQDFIYDIYIFVSIAISCLT
jgi:hypothetical protein